jgi:hypothetical protein
MAESLRRDYTTDRMTLTFRLKDDEGNERSRSSAKNTSGVRQPRPLRRMICAALIFGIISSECFVPRALGGGFRCLLPGASTFPPLRFPQSIAVPLLSLGALDRRPSFVSAVGRRRPDPMVSRSRGDVTDRPPHLGFVSVRH